MPPKPTDAEFAGAMEQFRPPTDLAEVRPGSLAESSQLLRRAIDSGITAESLEKLLGVHERIIRMDAERQFNEAIIAFQRNCPRVPRSGTRGDLKRVNARGVKEAARYSTLDDVVKTVEPELARHGLSFDVDELKVVEIAGRPWFQAVLRLRHLAGHSETKLGPLVPLGTQDIQPADLALAAQSRARTQALVYGLGLTSVGDDALDQPPPAEPVSAAQAKQLSQLLDALEGVTSADARAAWQRRILGRYNVLALCELPAAEYEAIADKIQSGIDRSQGT